MNPKILGAIMRNQKPWKCPKCGTINQAIPPKDEKEVKCHECGAKSILVKLHNLTRSDNDGETE